MTNVWQIFNMTNFQLGKPVYMRTRNVIFLSRRRWVPVLAASSPCYPRSVFFFDCALLTTSIKVLLETNMYGSIPINLS